jgi:hypothetical protein
MRRSLPLCLALLALGAGCAAEEEPLPFDSTTQNLHLRGEVSGLDLALVTAAEFEGEREYSPHLCEVAAKFVAEIDGADWSIDLELANFVPESFGVGRYEVVGVDVPQAEGQTVLELRLDGEAAHYERSGIGGFVDVKVYDSAAPQTETPGVLEGGSFGAIFEVDFGAGETVEGSFSVDFTTTTIEDDEC